MTKCVDRQVAERSAGSKFPAKLAEMAKDCIGCPQCRKECALLRQHGTPKAIAESLLADGDKADMTIAFECSLCSLCAAVCPLKLNPEAMFRELRVEAVRRGTGDFAEHGRLLDYERRGMSRRYSYYALPEGCDTVLIPGCTLPATRPEQTKQLFLHLRKTIPNLGIVLDCCGKPSYDFGRQDDFQASFGEMRSYLLANSVRHVLVACPSCFSVFKEHGGGLEARTVYEYLLEKGAPPTAKVRGTVTVHDPCTLRNAGEIQAAVRGLVTGQGLAIEEMEHHGKLTICCGEGGAAGFLAPELAGQWGAKRKQEAAGRRIISYCAGCTSLLGRVAATSHLLDLLFVPEATMAGKVKAVREESNINGLQVKIFARP